MNYRNQFIPSGQSVSLSYAQSASVIQEVKLLSVVHGWMSGGEGEEATLITLQIKFVSLKRSHRFKSAHISVLFEANDDFTVSKIAPDGLFEVPASNRTWQPGMVARDTDDIVHLRGSRQITDVTRTYGRTKDARIPEVLRLPILVQRRSSATFTAQIKVATQVSGFSIMPSGVINIDPIEFDPSRRSEGNSNISPINLGAIDILSLASLHRSSEFIPHTEVIQTEPEPAFEFLATLDTDAGNGSECWYLELWNLELSEGKTPVHLESKLKEMQPEIFKHVNGKSISQNLTKEDLNQYFAQYKEHESQEIVSYPSIEKGALRCALIAAKSKHHNRINRADLLNQPDIINFFELDDDIVDSRLHDRGICEVISEDSTSRKVYVFQTPFYTEGFWSLILHCNTIPGSVGPTHHSFGLIHVDSKVDLDEIFKGINDLAPDEKTFNAISQGLNNVDQKLIGELKTTKRGKTRYYSELYRKLSLNLYEHGMGLAELRRRRTFEDNIVVKLLPALSEVNVRLSAKANIYAIRGKAHDLVIESLPDKIETQRAILYNLIAQQDSNLSAKIASEALRDSKAMKTLSILTIVFLPGAFVATIFSTNMFTFRDNVQEIWIYFTIVIPLTALLMLGWIMWLSVTPAGGVDEEKGQTAGLRNTRMFNKGGKKD